MTMDLISGLAVTSAAFMIACSLVAILGRNAAPSVGDGHPIASRILATLVVVFFIVTADLLLIAQQVSLALGTFVVGVLLVVVLYMEPAVRGK